MNIFRKFIERLFPKDYRYINLNHLPSQGYFYNKDFTIKILKATNEDITFFEKNYNEDNYLKVLNLIKVVVKRNCIFNKNYEFNDIRAIDIMYIFFEIVKYTLDTDIKIFPDGDSKKFIKFNNNTFNYFNVSDELLNNFDENDRSFNINEWKYKLPAIGVESSVTKYILNNASDELNYMNYDFMYFLGDKNTLSQEEIEILLNTFTNDLGSKENIVKNITKSFSPFTKYSLVNNNGDNIDLSKINLEYIWKLK